MSTASQWESSSSSHHRNLRSVIRPVTLRAAIRPHSLMGRGLAIYVINNIKESQSVSMSVPKQYELLILNKELSQNALFKVVGIYRPPSAWQMLPYLRI